MVMKKLQILLAALIFCLITGTAQAASMEEIAVIFAQVTDHLQVQASLQIIHDEPNELAYVGMTEEGRYIVRFNAYFAHKLGVDEVAYTLFHEVCHIKLGHIKDNETKTQKQNHFEEFRADFCAIKLMNRFGYQPTAAYKVIELFDTPFNHPTHPTALGRKYLIQQAIEASKDGVDSNFCFNDLVSDRQLEILQAAVIAQEVLNYYGIQAYCLITGKGSGAGATTINGHHLIYIAEDIISRGTLSEIAFLISHEIAHIKLGHTQATNPTLDQARIMEFEADTEAFTMLVKLNCDLDAGESALKRFATASTKVLGPSLIERQWRLWNLRLAAESKQ